MVGVGIAVAGAALLGAMRLGQAWETGLRRGEFTDLPLPILIVLSAAVLISTPLALLGLAALAFAEERIEVGPEGITIERTAFERTRTDRFARRDLECWRETYLPLPPWWTWSVKRLAAREGRRLHPVAAAAGPREKRRIGEALAKATGKPLLGVSGRKVV
jgi:hypothetical protein